MQKRWILNLSKIKTTKDVILRPVGPAPNTPVFSGTGPPGAGSSWRGPGVSWESGECASLPHGAGASGVFPELRQLHGHGDSRNKVNASAPLFPRWEGAVSLCPKRKEGTERTGALLVRGACRGPLAPAVCPAPNGPSLRRAGQQRTGQSGLTGDVNASEAQLYPTFTPTHGHTAVGRSAREACPQKSCFSLKVGAVRGVRPHYYRRSSTQAAPGQTSEAPDGTWREQAGSLGAGGSANLHSHPQTETLHSLQDTLRNRAAFW